MKTKALVPAASIVVFLSAVGFASQQSPSETPAEKQFENIQVFKGVPAKEIDPAMETITSALGVRCSFCHVRDDKGEWHFEKDDKKEKQTAREMVLMMRKINADNFDGEMRVTCATCHQGKAEPSGIAPLGPVPPPAAAPASGGAEAPKLPEAKSLIDGYRVAIGGDAVDKITSLHVKSSQQQGQRTFSGESFAKSNGKVAFFFALPRGNVSEGFDGSSVWFKNEADMVFDLRDNDAEELKDSSPFHNLHLADQAKEFRRVRKDTIDGKDVYVVETRPAAGEDRMRLYFDATTGLLLRKWKGAQTILGILPSTEDFGDYRTVNGVLIPFKIVDTSHDGVTTITISEITANESIPDSKFAKPEGKPGKP